MPNPNQSALTQAFSGGDARAYVQSLLPKGPSSPQALDAIGPQLQSKGIQLQRNSGGDVRGRIYMPDAGSPYGHPVDLVSKWGDPWSYTDRGIETNASSGAPAPVNHKMNVAPMLSGQSDLMDSILSSLQQQQAQPIDPQGLLLQAMR